MGKNGAGPQITNAKETCSHMNDRCRRGTADFLVSRRGKPVCVRDQKRIRLQSGLGGLYRRRHAAAGTTSLLKKRMQNSAAAQNLILVLIGT